jgi:hypothetical protein
MKNAKIISFILKCFGYALGTFGGVLFIGSIGSFDKDAITFGQFILQELLAVGCIVMTAYIYGVREVVKTYYVED